MVRHWTVLLGMGLGLAVPLTLTQSARADDAYTKKEERKVTLEQLPEAVRATVLRETDGGTIKEIEEETKDGRTVYEVEFTPKEGARKVELKIGQDGKILKRETEY